MPPARGVAVARKTAAEAPARSRRATTASDCSPEHSVDEDQLLSPFGFSQIDTGSPLYIHTGHTYLVATSQLMQTISRITLSRSASSGRSGLGAR